MDWTALWLTLQVAGCTTGVLSVFGIPLAYWLARSRWRGKFLIEACVALPLILPPAVLGFYLLVAFSSQGLLGRGFYNLTGGTLPFSFPGIVVGSVLCNLPFAVRPFAASFAGVDPRLIEASWCLGVSKPQTFWRVTLPLAWPGILAGVVLTFAHAVGEFGVILMLGGNIAGVTRTLSISIYDDVQALNYQQANQTAFVLLVFSFVTLAALHAWGKRNWMT
ncbi:MAG: cysW 1 [Planctomycetaceae bacterium]|nr:cysW 1 [Planctomycetaceae bacterium]